MGNIIVNQTDPSYIDGSGNLVNSGYFGNLLINPVRQPVFIVERNPKDGPISQKETLADDQGQMVREYICAWDDRQMVCQQLLGYPVVSAKTNGGRYIIRNLPDFIPWRCELEGGFDLGYPLGNPRPFLWCTSLSVEPDGTIPPDGITLGPWNECRYGNAFISANYTTLSYEILSDTELAGISASGYWPAGADSFGNPDESSLYRYVTRQPAPQQKHITLPQGTYVFAAGDLNGNSTYRGTIGKIEIESDFSITWHRIPSPAVPLRFVNKYIANTVGGSDYLPPIENCLGTVNNATFAGCKKGTLLFSACILKPIKSPLGMRIWDIEYHFKFFNAKSTTSLTAGGNSGYQYGHNLVFYTGLAANPLAAGNAGYFEIVANTTGTPGSNYVLATPADNTNIFNYRDFTTLFKVPALAVDNA